MRFVGERAMLGGVWGVMSFALALGAGCRSESPGVASEAAGAALVVGSPGAATATPSLGAPLEVATLTALGAGEIVLDVAGARVLVGASLPAPPNADPPLSMRVRLVERGAPVAWPLAERPLSHARLLPEGGFVAVTPEGALLAVDGATGAVTEVDTDAVGPLGTSADGRHVVYCRGESPLVEV